VLSPPAFSLFSLQHALTPPLPPSFPTRRSSDLVLRRGAVCSAPLDRQAGELAPPAVHESEERATAHQRGEHRGRDAEGEHHDVRSEEHTSELQSPCNLVCRLLLEKKKKKKKRRP